MEPTTEIISEIKPRIDINNIIEVKQLPIITQQLYLAKEYALAETSHILDLPCNEDTVKAIKVLRSDLNKTFKKFEDKRKEIKSLISRPYDEFNAVYNDCISAVFGKADEELKTRISQVENKAIIDKTEKIKKYFDEYVADKDIKWLEFDRAGIKVKLSSSMKSLFDAVDNFVNGVVEDLRIIKLQDFSDEIFIEYQKSLNLNASISDVVIRHEMITRMNDVKATNDVKPNKMSDYLQPPTVEQTMPAEQKLKLTFTVVAERSELKKLKEFLMSGNFEIVK